MAIAPKATPAGSISVDQGRCNPLAFVLLRWSTTVLYHKIVGNAAALRLSHSDNIDVLVMGLP